MAEAALRERLRPFWPAMVERIGDRWPAFEDAVRSKAALRGLQGEAALARYAGLCLRFGPGFEDKPEHEWALAVLADERLGEWVKLHQVVLRAADTLRRKGSDADALLAADAALVDALDAQQRAADPDAAPLPRVACDIDALDLRLLPCDWRREQRLVDGAWQWVAAAAPASVRIDAKRPAPARLALLSHAPGDGPAAMLQLRQILHGGCAGERHPAARWLDARGLQRWQGHEARAVSWPVHAMAQPPAPPGLATPLVEQTSPAVHLLDVPSCGLRDQGVPQGSAHLPVWAYPAHQWFFALKREGLIEGQGAPAAGAQAPGPRSAVRVERDGQLQAAPGWAQGFDAALQAAWLQGLQQLWAAWSAAVGEPAMQHEAELLAGRSALAWGWREGAGGLGDAPVLRVQAEIDLACRIDLQLAGDVEVGASRTRLRLHAQGGAPLRFACHREQPLPSVLDTLLPARVQWRCPFALDFDPIANEPPVLCQSIGPCTGAIVGEAGLRPRAAGSGWQWFVRIALEPVLAPLTLCDPVLGDTQRKLALLSAMPLLDWSLG